MKIKSNPLRSKYPCIVCWGKELLSYDYYIDNQCQEAEDDCAPRSAVYKKDDGTWIKAEDFSEPLRSRLLAALRSTNQSNTNENI